MELICPACEARYELPEGSISEKGRQVSCMNCGHGWHAYPPLVLGTGNTRAAPARSPAPAPAPAANASPSTGIQWGGPQGSGVSPVATPKHEPRLADPDAGHGPAHEPPRPEPQIAEAPSDAAAARQAAVASGRTEQLAELREMLAEVQTEGHRVAAADPAAPASSEPTRINVAQHATPAELEAQQARQRLAEERAEAQRAAAAAAGSNIDADEDDLRRRLGQVADRDQQQKTAASNVKKIRKRHDRKVKRRKHAEAAGSGAFFTGFLLVAMIAALMVSLYVLHPQIIAKVPEAEGPLNQYVATMDRLRVSTAETFVELRDAIVEAFGDGE